MKLTITQKDQTRAKGYTDTGNCLVATMLKNRGYVVRGVGPFIAHTDGKTFEIKNPRRISAQLYDNKCVKSSAIGKKIELIEV